MTRGRKRPGKRGDRTSTDSGPSADDEEPLGGEDAEIATLVSRHVRFGWRLLLLYLALGLFLDALHAFKVGWYLEVVGATRREMWTLAHSHGTLLAVLNLVFAGTVRLVPGWSYKQRRFASVCLLSAAALLPAGFFLGGCFPHEGDPGVGILLVPIGGLLLMIAVLLAARR